MDEDPDSKRRIMAEGSGATSNVVGLSADIVAAYVTKNHIQKDELPALIVTVHDALRSAAIGVLEPPKPEPVTPPNKSVRPGSHSLPVRRQEVQVVETSPAHQSQHDPAGIPRDFRVAARLSDGGSGLRVCSIRFG